MNSKAWIELAEASLWGVQFILAISFGYTGLSKLFVPADRLREDERRPVVARSLGALEAVGAIGLLLPIVAETGERAIPIIAVALAVLAGIDLALRWRHRSGWSRVGVISLIVMSLLAAVLRATVLPR